MKEEWRPVVGYEGLYEASNLGRIRNTKTGRTLSACPLNNGYIRVLLVKDRVKRGFSVHRLVAQAFIPNPENKPEVNHIDGNKANNRVDNLEWCTRSENQIHKFRALGANRPGPKPLYRIRCIETGKIFNGYTEASRKTGVNRTTLSSYLRNKPIKKPNGKSCELKTAGGFHWEYVD